MGPLEPAAPKHESHDAIREATKIMMGVSDEEAEAIIQRCTDGEWFMNELYTVIRKEIDDNPYWPCPIIHLSIRRNDREPITDWRHMQKIKNEVTDPEFDAIQLYPKESRLVDSANQYHLWVFASQDFMLPVGWTTRMVSETEVANSKQRPLEQ